MAKRNKGRPFGSFKYMIEGKPVPIDVYKKYLSGIKKKEDIKKVFCESKGISLQSLKVQSSLIKEIDDCLSEFNSRSIVPLTKKDFITIILRSGLKTITEYQCGLNIVSKK